MAPKRFNVLNALRFIIKRFNERVTFEFKSALRRFKCLGSLNSAENVGNGVGTFGKLSRNTLVACSSLEVTHKGLGRDFCQNKKTLTQDTVLFTTFRVPYAVLRYGGAQFWCFLLVDLSVGVQTAARAPFCPLFAGIHR